MKIIKKIRLKKDTPDHKAGELFVLMSNNGIYEIDAGEDDPSVFYGGDIESFDEWFEKVSDEWPQEYDTVWSISSDGTPYEHNWRGYSRNMERKDIGNVFKTKEAAERFVNYLKAITTVRQDEGVLTPEQIKELEGKAGDVYCVTYTSEQNEELLRSCTLDFGATWAPVGSILFDTSEHAEASLDKHPDEWKTIANYDWSKE